MSAHRECGEDIIWARNPNDVERWMPPLQFAGPRFIISDGLGVYVDTYVTHRCDPEKMMAWREYQTQLATINERYPQPSKREAYEAARQRDTEEAWEYALRFDCPKCNQLAGIKCLNLTKLKQNELVETAYPHPARMSPALASAERQAKRNGKAKG